MKVEGTVLEIIANANKLTHAGKDIWVDPEGRRFVVNRYGFQPVELTPTEHQLKALRAKYTDLINHLEKTLMKRNRKIQELYIGLEKFIGKQATKSMDEWVHEISKETHHFNQIGKL
jgi:hypothetical protein